MEVGPSHLGIVTWRVSSRLPSAIDDHLQAVMGYLVAASRRAHHVDANLVVAARWEGALVMVLTDGAVEHGPLVFAGG